MNRGTSIATQVQPILASLRDRLIVRASEPQGREVVLQLKAGQDFDRPADYSGAANAFDPNWLRPLARGVYAMLTAQAKCAHGMLPVFDHWPQRGEINDGFNMVLQWGDAA